MNEPSLASCPSERCDSTALSLRQFVADSGATLWVGVCDRCGSRAIICTACGDPVAGEYHCEATYEAHLEQDAVKVDGVRYTLKSAAIDFSTEAPPTPAL